MPTNDNDYQEVYFNVYCERCKYWEKDALGSPCEHCLDNPINLHSHKPVDFKEAIE